MIKQVKKKGFTLLEMMVVIVIIAILAVIAFPSYQKYLLKANRVEARNQLQAAAQRLEQNFTANRSYKCAEWKVDADGSYSTSNGDRECNTPINTAWLVSAGYGAAPAGAVDDKKRYEISFSVEPSSREYTLQAVPVNIQERDYCGTFTINQSNVKAIVGEENTRTQKTRDCWGF